MGQRAAIYDLTLFDTDGTTPLWGSVSSGVITESSFQTPDPNKSHDRPWMKVPDASTAARIDFVRGSNSIGVVGVKVVDKRKTATDQTTGTITEKLKSTIGCRAVLRRWDGTNNQWLVLRDGVVHNVRVDRELVVYDFSIRDGREFERGGDLFSSNYVLWGKDGREGPAIDYGTMPIDLLIGTLDAKLLSAVEPFESVDRSGSGGVSHFKRLSAASPLDGIYYGYSPVSTGTNGTALRLPDLGWPTQRKDGFYYYDDIKVRWRVKGSGDPWTTLTEMPAGTYRNAVVPYNGGLLGFSWHGSNIGVPSLYFGSTDPTEVPTDGQEIEFQVLAVNITEETPFFWDGGTLGDLLQEIVNGDHTDTAPQEQYSASALSSFAASSPKARFILREPVTDRRRWVEENIYQPAFVAPTVNTSGEIAPTSWTLPDNAESVPVLDEDDIQNIGEYEDGTERAIRKVEYTYIREHLDPIDTVVETESPSWWQFWKDDIRREVPDPEDTRLDWERLVETEVTKEEAESTAIPGAKTISYKPTTIRSIAGAAGFDFSGDVQDELGNRLFRKAVDTVLPRYKRGAASYVADVRATDTILNYQTGDWLRVRAEWLPEYSTGKRGMRRYMQIYGISDIDPSTRKLYLVDGGVPDPTGDEDLVDPNETDCLTGGTLSAAPTGASMRLFEGDGTLENTCGDDIVLSQVLLIAGGGGGGQPSSGNEVGGGGGEGGVVIATNVTIKAGEQVPVRIGGGGATDTDGDDTVLWVDGNGNALNPATDPTPSATTADGGGGGGGGEAAGSEGGSGGGAGTVTSAGAGQPGGNGTQGSDGGGSNGTGGTSTCGKAAGGGGGSDAQTGGTGSVAGQAEAGDGGAGSSYGDFGLSSGGGGGGGAVQQAPNPGDCSSSGGEFERVGTSGSGYGAGGGGGAGSKPASTGSKGVLAVVYAGAHQTLDAPSVTSTSTTSEQQVEICVEDADWPTVEYDGYRVKVEYATGDSEPAEDSGDWQLAGYLENPGCVKTDALPTGATVWHRITAEADDFLPSEPGTAGSDSLPQTAGLVGLAIAIDESDPATATLSWTANPYASSLEIRGEVHASSDTLSDPLPVIDVVRASGSPFVASNNQIPEDRFLTVDVVAYDDIGGTYEDAVIADSPLAYLRLGDSSGTTAEDSSGNNNDGTYHNSPTLGASGLLTDDPDTAVTFDGNNDDAEMSGVAAIGSDATRTLEFWISTTESGQVRPFGLTNSGDSTFWFVSLNRDADGTSNAGRTTIQARDAGGDIHNESFDENIYDGNPHHVVVAQDGHTSWRIYVDGSEITPANTFDSGTYNNPSNWDVGPMIGARNNAGTATDHANVTMDEVAIYASALSAARVSAHYTAGTSPDFSTAGTEGKTHRVSIENVAETLATATEVDGVLDNLVFNNDLGLVLDNDLIPAKGNG